MAAVESGRTDDRGMSGGLTDEWMGGRADGSVKGWMMGGNMKDRGWKDD